MKPRPYKINTFELLADDELSDDAEDSFDSQRAKTRDTFTHRSECDPKPSPYDIDQGVQRALQMAAVAEEYLMEPIVYFDDEIELVIEQNRPFHTS